MLFDWLSPKLSNPLKNFPDPNYFVFQILLTCTVRTSRLFTIEEKINEIHLSY